MVAPAELADAREGLLRLLQSPAPLGGLGQPLVEEHAKVTLGNAGGRTKLMREDM